MEEFFRRMGSDFPSHSLREVDHVIVDQDRLPRTVVPVDDHLPAFGHSDGSGGVLRGVGQEVTVGSSAIPIAVLELDRIECDDASLFVGHGYRPRRWWNF